MAWVVLHTIVHTVEIPSPKSVAIVLYSMFVANRQMVTATCLSTVTGKRYLVTVFPMYGLSWLHSIPKVALLILKFSNHHSSPNTPALAASQYACECGLHQTLRSA